MPRRSDKYKFCSIIFALYNEITKGSRTDKGQNNKIILDRWVRDGEIYERTNRRNAMILFNDALSQPILQTNYNRTRSFCCNKE